MNLTLAPTHGAAGSSVQATGGSLSAGTETEFYWDTVDPGNFLGQVLSDSSGEFIFNFNVPTGASAGAHQVIVVGSDFEASLECPADFTVDASAQQTAYSTQAPAASLPNTGVFLLIPAAGLAVGGLDGIVLRRQRQS